MAMKRRNWIAMLLAFLAGTAVGHEYSKAPSDSTLGARAKRFTENKRGGALALLSAMAVATAWIGIVRTRQRRQRRTTGA